MAPRVRISEDVTPDKIVLRSEGLGGITVGVEIEVNFHVTVPAGTKLRLRSANGDITMTNVDGTIVASSSNGAIIGKALRGGIDARATNGSITIDMAAVSKDPIDLRATNGSHPVVAAADGKRQYRGHLHQRLRRLQRPAVAARRRADQASDPRPAERRRHAYRLTTTNGDIHCSHRRLASPPDRVCVG